MSEPEMDEVCGRCGRTWGRHMGVRCPDFKGVWSNPTEADLRAQARALAEALRELLGTLVGEEVPDTRLSTVELQARRALRAWEQSNQSKGEG